MENGQPLVQTQNSSAVKCPSSIITSCQSVSVMFQLRALSKRHHWPGSSWWAERARSSSGCGPASGKPSERPWPLSADDTTPTLWRCARQSPGPAGRLASWGSVGNTASNTTRFRCQSVSLKMMVRGNVVRRTAEGIVCKWVPLLALSYVLIHDHVKQA